MNGRETLHRVAVPDGEVMFRDVGADAPVVFLHGGMLDHRMWQPQLDALAASQRVIAPDARGYGRSSTPTGPSRACDDVAALIEALELAPVTLVGLSLGARTAVDTTLEHPHLVRGLVVSGAGAGAPDFRDPFILTMFAEWEAAARARDGQRFVDAFLRLATGESRELTELPAELVEYQRAAVTDNLAAHQGPDAVQPTDVDNAAARVDEIRVPTLGIVGALDSDDHIRSSAALIEATGGRLAHIESTAHYPNLERPDEFTALLREFLPTNDGASKENATQ